jgi:hypothetical protein
MKKLYTLFLALLAILTVNAQLATVSIDLVYSDDGTIEGYPEGFNTWRIYAHFDGEDDFLSGVYALFDGQPLTLGSSTNQIWNSAFGGVTRDDINDVIVQQFPAVAYDSYIALGSGSNAPGSVQYLATAPLSVFTDHLHVSGTEDEFDTNLIIEDGIWFNLMGDVDAVASGAENEVLIAQITTDGDIDVCLNFQVFPGGQAGSLALYDNFCETAQAPVGLEEVAEVDFQMSPNPATNYTIVSYLNDGSIGGQVEVLDLSGRVVWTAKMNNARTVIDVSTFAEGLYLVRLKDQQGNAIRVEKLLVD